MAGAEARDLWASMHRRAIEAAAGDAERVKWVTTNLKDGCWAPKVLNGLLNDSMADAAAAHRGEAARLSSSMRSFAEELALIELEALVDHCLEQCQVQDGGQQC